MKAQAHTGYILTFDGKPMVDREYVTIAEAVEYTITIMSDKRLSTTRLLDLI